MTQGLVAVDPDLADCQGPRPSTRPKPRRQKVSWSSVREVVACSGPGPGTATCAALVHQDRHLPPEHTGDLEPDHRPVRRCHPLAHHIGHRPLTAVEHRRLAHPVATTRPAQCPADVLLVGPAVEDPAGDEVAVGHLALRAPSEDVEPLGRERSEFVDAPPGHADELGEHLVAGKPPSRLHPRFIQIGEGIADMVRQRGERSGWRLPRSILSTPIRWATWSRTVHPGQSVGSSHWVGPSRSHAEASDVHTDQVVDARLVVRLACVHLLPSPRRARRGSNTYS